MRFLLRMFAAFCIATVLAQGIILIMAAAKGNLHKETITQALALFNGIDISGEKLQRVYADSQEVPVPSYDDVVAQRAKENLNLEMRERSVKREKEQVLAMQAKLQDEMSSFDRRKDAFYQKLDKMDNENKTANLGEVQRTLEALSPEQAKMMLVKMIEANQMPHVVAIIKGMSLEKRKKIMGEFATEKESSQIYEVLNQILSGQPAASVIDQARSEAGGDTK